MHDAGGALVSPMLGNVQLQHTFRASDKRKRARRTRLLTQYKRCEYMHVTVNTAHTHTHTRTHPLDYAELDLCPVLYVGLTLAVFPRLISMLLLAPQQPFLVIDASAKSVLLAEPEKDAGSCCFPYGTTAW